MSSSTRLMLVLGMHRSGTSAITRSLDMLGFQLGDNLMPPAPGNNEKGFWEDLDINRLNVRLMKMLDYDWNDVRLFPVEKLTLPEIADLKLEAAALLRGKLERFPCFGLKDPRVCRLMPFWREVFEHLDLEVGYVIACRNPMSVAQSLAKRDGFSAERGYLLWRDHMLDSLLAVEAEKTILVDYDALLEDPGKQLRRVAEKFSLEFSQESESYRDYTESFLEGGLRHDHRMPEDIRIDRSAPPEAYPLYLLLLQLASDQRSLGDNEVQEALRNFDQARRGAAFYLNSLQGLEIKNRSLQVSAGKKDEQLKVLTEQKLKLEGQVQQLSSVLDERDKQLSLFAGQKVEIEHQNERLQAELQLAVSDQEQLAGINAQLHESIARQELEIARCGEQADLLGREKASLEAELRETIGRHQVEVRVLREQLAKHDQKHRDFLSAIHSSSSWKLTKPLRAVGGVGRRVRSLKNLLPSLIRRAGGLRGALSKAAAVYRREGAAGVRARLVRHSVEQAALAGRGGGNRVAGKRVLTLEGNKTVAAVVASSDTSLQTLVAQDEFQQADCTLKTAVVLHAFHMDVLPELLRRIRNIRAGHDIFISVARERRAELDDLLEREGVSASIVEVENGGYDILPFIKCIPLLVEGGYDLVCKLHTKKGLANLEKLYPDAGNAWLDMLLDPIMGSEEAVRQVLHAFSCSPALGMLGSADLYKSVRHLMYGNDVEVARLALQLSPASDPAQPWGFFAGSIFWSRTQILEPLIGLLPELEKASDSPAKTGSISSVWHALERIMGMMPRLGRMQTGLAYCTDAQGAVRIALAEGSALQDGSRYPVGVSLGGYINLPADRAFLQARSEFSEAFYRQAYPHVQSLGVDPLFHFLRYGVYEACNPSPEFSAAWYWDEHRDVLSNRINPLVHYLRHGAREGRSHFPAAENQAAIMSLVEASACFDARYYLQENQDVAKSRIPPLQHFILHGWKEARQPISARAFDLIWYAAEYLQDWRSPINPLLHYAACRKQRKLLPRPQVSKIELAAGHSLPAGQKPRRICLFAGYDPQGICDDYVVQFIEELQRHADVYYLADSEMQPGELEKLAGLTKGAWAFRHGEYDFGSYSRLARDLVGWERIREYDELLLINDSSYLLKSLQPLFDKMDAKACDWWGLQATKGLSATRDVPSNRFRERISMDMVLKRLLPGYEKDECYDFHIGSYFLAFRRPVLAQGGVLQRLLGGVRKERNKKHIIQRYEIGLTRRLLLAGHRPATFIDHLYPFHPIYTKCHFDLLRDGFPLFKRFLLTENHYHVPELWRWKEWVRAILPQADLDAAERNLLRIGNADKLYRTLHIPADGRQWPEVLLSDAQFQKEDLKTEKDDRCWAFPVCAYDHLLSGNERVLFDAVKDDPRIRKVVLTRSKCVQLEGVNVDIVPLKSLAGQRLLMQARYIFIKHAPRINTLYPLDAQLHRFINLWHGIPLKRIGYASLDLLDKLESVSAEHARCHAVIASSKVDRLAMAAAFYPLSFHDVWITGLPRNDVILREETLLPADFQAQLARLRQALVGRRLVLFAPTFRNAQAQAYYPFSEAERKALADCLHAHGAVLGIREHMADKAQSYSESLGGAGMPVISLDRRYYADIELLYREAELLITDYSSCFIDFMLTGKPEICFAYDYESYAGSERGLFYELDDVFPGPVCHDFPALLESLERILQGQVLESESAYRFKQKLFFDHVDDRNSQRLIEHIEHEIGAMN